MERSAIAPHISWSGPQPDREIDAYLLAMLVRIYSSGLETDERDAMLHPSVLTTSNLHTVSIMYAFYKEQLEYSGIRNTENMLKLIKDSDDDGVSEWMDTSTVAIKKAEAELLEFVDTRSNPGFSVFG